MLKGSGLRVIAAAAIAVMALDGCYWIRPGSSRVPSIPIDTVLRGPFHLLLWSKETATNLEFRAEPGQIVRVEVTGAPLGASFSVSEPVSYLGGNRYTGGDWILHDSDDTDSGRPLGGDFVARSSGPFYLGIGMLRVGESFRLTIRPVETRLGKPAGTAPRELVIARRLDVVHGQRPPEAAECLATEVLVAYIRGHRGTHPRLHLVDTATGKLVKTLSPHLKTGINYVELGRLAVGTYRVEMRYGTRGENLVYSKAITIRN